MIGYITDGIARMSRLVEDLLSLALASGITRDVSQPTSMQNAFQPALKA